MTAKVAERLRDGEIEQEGKRTIGHRQESMVVAGGGGLGD